MVPDQIPKDLTKDMRRFRAYESVKTNLTAATKRLNGFTAGKSHHEIIRKVHTARTEIVNDSDATEIVNYYSLWTDFADMRLTESGELLRNDDEISDKLRSMAEHGFDESDVVGIYELRTNEKKYKTSHLLSLALALEKFLQVPK
jgi:hypothetical protein